MANSMVHPEILAMARGLKVSGKVDPIDGIIEYCLRKVKSWMEDVEGIEDVASLETLVTQRLRIVIHEIWSDADLASLQNEYLAKGEPGIAMSLEAELSGINYATLFERMEGITARSTDRYVAFVDCRTDEKAQRRFFTRWHEIAHVLTLYKQLELPLHRSYRMDNNEAEERLMDKIASRVGFFPSLFDPLAGSITNNGADLTFDMAEQVIAEYAPDASFDATLNALLRIAKTPVLKLKMDMAFKESEKRMLAGGSFLIPEARPTPKLRVVESLGNQKAREAGVRIHRNMRVPQHSIIARTYGSPLSTGFADEDMEWWTSSRGGALPKRSVRVESRYIGERLFALVLVR